MTSRVRKSACLSVVCCVALMLILLEAPTECFAFEISIDVSPNIVNIGSQGEAHTVGVHTNMPYAGVAVLTVFINDQLIESWKKADSRGYLVAKFYLDELDKLADLVIDGDNTITLLGMTNDPEDPQSFWGEDDIFVVDKQGF